MSSKNRNSMYNDTCTAVHCIYLGLKVTCYLKVPTLVFRDDGESCMLTFTVSVRR